MSTRYTGSLRTLQDLLALPSRGVDQQLFSLYPSRGREPWQSINFPSRDRDQKIWDSEKPFQVVFRVSVILAKEFSQMKEK